jgi:predicted nucleic acid-binding protein
MLLVDSTIWVDHIRRSDNDLVWHLESEMVLVHPFVVGEIALGQMKNLELFLARLNRLPKAVVASSMEVLALIQNRDLSGSGIGYVDAHLVASCLLMSDVRLWTRDKRLKAVAQRLSVAADL